MQGDTKYTRLMGRLSLAGVWTGVSVALSAVLFALSVIAYGVYLEHWHSADAPATTYLVIAALGTVVIGITALYVWLVVRAVSASISAFSDYLGDARRDLNTDLTLMHFSELRRLRVSLLRTVGKLRRELDTLKAAAFTDSRTGLSNLTALERYLSTCLPRASRTTPGALIYLEIDEYTRWCEVLGASAGPALLSGAVQRLELAIRAADTDLGTVTYQAELYALHGERFALALPNIGDRNAVVRVARALRAAFASPLTIAGRSVQMNISGGIAMMPEDGETAHQLLKNAELALKAVRDETKTGFRFYAPRLNRVERGRYRLEEELRAAVAAKEFRAVFQPKIDFVSGKIIGAEALARWQRPGGKMISPATFIPLAEELGLISEIGNQILEQACQSARTWARDGHDVTVAVNVSPLQLEQSNFAEKVLDILKRTGLPPHRLELEITETMAVSNPDRVATVMQPLKAMGMALAIDDFGTGHSNLTTLTRLPFDVFKIDRSFVSALESDAQAPAIVEMILAMAETLGLKTVAEGVETPRQADFLRRRGCTMAQGFLYGKGVNHAKFIELLRNWEPRRVHESDGFRQAG